MTEPLFTIEAYPARICFRDNREGKSIAGQLPDRVFKHLAHIINDAVKDIVYGQQAEEIRRLRTELAALQGDSNG